MQRSAQDYDSCGGDEVKLNYEQESSDADLNLVKELKDGLSRIYWDRLKGVYIYGSYARGEERPDSDIDVMIVLDDYQSYGKEIDRTGELVSRLSLEYGISISRVIMKEMQWMESDTPLLRNIRMDGVPA